MFKKVIPFILIVLLVGIAYLITLGVRKFQVLRNGEYVEVVMYDASRCRNDKHDSPKGFKFFFEEGVFYKRYRGNCNTIYKKFLRKDLRLHLITNKDRSVFLFPDENLFVNLISYIIIFCVFGYTAFRVIKK
jgi:hypothetical protein